MLNVLLLLFVLFVCFSSDGQDWVRQYSLCYWFGLYFCFVCCLNEVSCIGCYWWLGDARSYIQVVSFVWVLTVWYFSGSLVSKSQCSHSKGSGLDLWFWQLLVFGKSIIFNLEGWRPGESCSLNPKSEFWQNSFLLREVSLCSVKAFNWLDEADLLLEAVLSLWLQKVTYTLVIKIATIGISDNAEGNTNPFFP